MGSNLTIMGQNLFIIYDPFNPTGELAAMCLVFSFVFVVAAEKQTFFSSFYLPLIY